MASFQSHFAPVFLAQTDAYASRRRPLRPPLLHLLLVAVMAVAASACSSAAEATPAANPDDPSTSDTSISQTSAPEAPTTTQRPARTTTTQPPDIGAGTPEQPFVALPAAAEATAVVSPAGVVLPVVSERTDEAGRESWIVMTPCSDVRVVSGVQPLGRAHVVLDPGHGGNEFGATGPNDLTEKDLNLSVALAAASMLREAGATVILTRTTDVTMTTGVRAALARTVNPALFVSIHHNGGAPANGDLPGTIVFTKSNSPSSTRFGGLFHQTLSPQLLEIGATKQAEFVAYAEAFVAHEATVAAYDQSLAARDAALVTNGQIDPTATTLPPTEPSEARERIDGTEVAGSRQPVTTTTMPVPDDRETVPVPDTLPLPGTFETERVAEFKWAGTGNAGVRSWRADDGKDLLSVLRRSGDVPAALVEYLYVTNPVEAELLADPAFIELEARALADSIVRYLSTSDEGTGFVIDQVGDQDIGGGGHRNDCVEPDLGLVD